MADSAETLNLETLEDIEFALADLEESRPEPTEETPGQGYDDGEYWDNRYGTWAVDPYDWLVEYADVEPFIDEFFDKKSPVLCPGCGNAPFHPRMYEAGYTKQICLDTSEIVIEQSLERFGETHPEMSFAVADCTNLPDFQDQSIKYILDKSLIDTLRCEAGSYEICERFIGEMYRVLQDGGVMVTISLNSYTVEDITQYYERSHWNWTVAYGNIVNPQYEKAKDNTPFYTLIVASKRHPDPELKPLLHALIEKSNARYEFGDEGTPVLMQE